MRSMERSAETCWAAQGRWEETREIEKENGNQEHNETTYSLGHNYVHETYENQQPTIVYLPN